MCEPRLPFTPYTLRTMPLRINTNQGYPTEHGPFLSSSSSKLVVYYVSYTVATNILRRVTNLASGSTLSEIPACEAGLLLYNTMQRNSRHKVFEKVYSESRSQKTRTPKTNISQSQARATPQTFSLDSMRIVSSNQEYLS